jgi:SNF2 family DNA or RNA helicase
VENHIGELWSIFEFLNPGMLGASAAFRALGNGFLDTEDLGLMRRTLRPFILRRTKEQVLRELPSKTEQTIHCGMDEAQRKFYDKLRNHVRATVSRTIETQGFAKSKIHVLEALLRLRQAACHPALVDPATTAGSCKLDALVEQLDEVIEGGHRALVFSQFTSLLALVRTRFEAHGVSYEYLDGQTRDRKERVEHFQTDESCKVFLISLKAGGQGLNLTGADYVFILDPWWNPAVEAQAIDRTHRIGQSRHVFAYRLIASGTVEEKILELQARKRGLADAILKADARALANLTAEDLRVLLG